LRYNVGYNNLGDEGCFYVAKSNWKITKLWMSKLVIIKMKTVSKMLSTVNNSALNPSHKSLYDAKQSIIGLTNIVVCLLGGFDKLIYLFNENNLSDFCVYSTFIIKYLLYRF